MKFYFFLLLSCCITISLKAQQDSQFTQYIFNGLHINPAYAGTKGDLYVQSFYRAQWQGIKGAPRTFSIAADDAFKEGKVGLGMIISNDQIGAQSNLSAFANYAYHLNLNDNESSTLSFGLAAGMMQLGIDGSLLLANNPGDMTIPFTSQTQVFPDARLGVYFSNDNYYAGFSATNVLAKYMSNSKDGELLLPIPQPHFYLTAGALFTVNEDVDFKPSFLIKDDTRGPVSLDLNAFFLLKERVWLGGFYRSSYNIHNRNLQKDLPTNNSIGLMTEIFATPDIRIGYSYDYSIDKLQNYNAGSHEISVGFYINKKENRKDYRRNRETRCYAF